MSIWTAGFSLFLVCNVLGNMPFYLALLKSFPPRRQRVILMREMCIAILILLIFGFFGDQVLKVLRINQIAIEIGGGLLLLLVSLRMIFPKPASEQVALVEPMIFPIAIPGIAGPGGIATVTLLAGQMTSTWGILAPIAIASIPSLAILFFSSHIKTVMGKQGLFALERFGGLLMTLIATQLIASGIIHLIKENFIY